jgi:hypothetical protein
MIPQQTVKTEEAKRDCECDATSGHKRQQCKQSFPIKPTESDLGRCQ